MHVHFMTDFLFLPMLRYYRYQNAYASYNYHDYRVQYEDRLTPT